MYHILVAEDERIERMALVKVLSDALGEGYAIHEAENGRQAVELFRQHPIGVAILDIEMPVNLVFLLMFCFVLVVLLSLSIAITQLADKCKRLTQENALLEKRVRELERRLPPEDRRGE